MQVVDAVIKIIQEINIGYYISKNYSNLASSRLK